MSNTRRNVAFLLILAILIALSSYIIKPSVPIVAESETSDIFAKISSEPENTIDVLVIGDSESYTSVSPMELWKQNGTTSFICGQSALTIQRAYFLLKEALKTQEPKLLLMETNMLFRHDGNVKAAETFVTETMNYYLPLFYYHNDWKKLVNSASNGLRDFKGFSIRSNVDPYSGEEYMKQTKEKQAIANVVKKYTTEIIKLCKENDIQVILYSAPSPKNHNYKRHNALQVFADDNNCEYLDLNLKINEIGINWSIDTMDKGDHLNITGTQKASIYLAQYLEENYTLIDHRKDANYQAWTSLLELYEKETAKL